MPDAGSNSLVVPFFWQVRYRGQARMRVFEGEGLLAVMLTGM